MRMIAVKMLDSYLRNIFYKSYGKLDIRAVVQKIKP